VFPEAQVVDAGICLTVVCDQPPANTCSGSDVVSYSSIGTCQPSTGQCIYSSTMTPCPNGCSNGQCSSSMCPTGEIPCSGVCTDVSSDPNNCGQCGYVCPPGDSCIGDQCMPGSTCLAGETDCPGFGCTDTTQDPFNCGGCGIQCTTGLGLCLCGFCF
jgi:hypothetical protein